MSERGEQTKSIFDNLGVDFETKRTAKEQVFSGIVDAGRLLDEGSPEEAGQRLSQTQAAARKLHENGQLSEPYMQAANVVMNLLGSNKAGRIERGVLSECARQIVTETGQDDPDKARIYNEAFIRLGLLESSE